MLIGGQHPVSAADISMHQMGRKIMPKPPLYGQMTNLVSPFTLAPLPIPACSISIAPTMFPADSDSHKKKRSRKKKTKELETPVSKDIVAAATEGLFSPPATTQAQITEMARFVFYLLICLLLYG